MLNIPELEIHPLEFQHDHPCLFRKGGGPVRLGSGGIDLGILPDYEYEADAVAFGPGDVLVVYSDGIVESVNAEREQFGADRLLAVVSANLDAPAEGILSAIVDAAVKHAGEPR